MKTKILLLLPLAFALVAPGTSRSGPNAGGVVIFHALPDVDFSSGEDWCDQLDLENCPEAIVSDEGDGVATFFILAAFPVGGSPRLAGTTFGIHYSADDIEVLDWGVCGDFHLPTNDWPGPGSGTAVTWSEAQTDYIVEIHWLAAQSVSGNPANIAVGDHPSRGGGAYFADDDVPSNIDNAVDLGKFGFGGDGGYLPCPDPVPTVETTWGQVKVNYR